MDAFEPLIEDEYDRQLAAQVHPSNWPAPQNTSRYHLVVIGGGTAGLVTAAGAASLGARVALIEGHLMGGDCLNTGCVPSKAVLRAAHVAAQTRNISSLGISGPEPVQVDFSQVMKRMRQLRASISSHDSAERFQQLGVDIFFGKASFAGTDTVRVGANILRFRKAVIATGARASVPKISGLESVEYLTNETIFSLTELPPRLAVIGAGPIGCELAQAFARFGSEVFLIESSHGILPREEPDAAAVVKSSLIRDGVRLLCCGRDLKLSPDSGGIRLKIASHETSYDGVVDRLLLAVGRTPNVEGLQLETVGVQYDRQAGVIVNDRLQTTNRHIYAAGDICTKTKFTHAADAMARIVIGNALFGQRGKVSRLVIPWCTYTSPEIARVGLSAKEAAERKIAIDTYTQPLADIDRAVLDDQTEGFIRIHTRRGTATLLGATIVAERAGDLIGEVSLAMTHGLGLKQLASTIYPYPTYVESFRKLGDQYNRTRLTPFVKSLMAKWLAWRK